jgi:hypothetical protein
MGEDCLVGEVQADRGEGQALGFVDGHGVGEADR